MHIGILESNLSGSGFEGIAIAKKLGHRTTFFTRDLDRYLEVPGGTRYFDEYVDEIVRCETNELEPLLKQVRAIAEHTAFDAFMTMGEYDVVLAAQTARELGLPTADPDAVAVARNKVWMRERCAEHQIPMPAFRSVATVEETREAVRAVGLPCVVKPADETSSVDVVRCVTAREAEEHFLAIRGKKVNTRGQERYSRILVEECLRGHEVSVEVLAERTDFHVLGVTDKAVAGHGHFVEIGHVFPSMLPEALTRQCADIAVASLRAVGFDLGLAHVEVKITEAGPKLVEINPRPAGDHITELVDRALDISCLELMVRQYLGERVLSGLTTQVRAGAAIRYLSAAPGRTVGVSGQEIAQAMPGIVAVVVKVAHGDEVRPLRRNADRLGHVMAIGTDGYTASRLAEAAAQEIVVQTRTDTMRQPVQVVDSVADMIGGTPMIRVSVDGAGAGTTVLAKLEMVNPLSSIKDRAGLFMLRAAEERGQFSPGAGTVVEATSGNTGISLAALAAARGYRCVIVMPDSATKERIGLVRALGAEVVLTPREAGYLGAIAKAEEIHAATPNSWFPRQHENVDNIRAHYETTGPEIWTDTDGKIDVLVCGVGTGGTLTGIARYLLERNPMIRIVAAEPEKSPILSRGVGGLHRIPGLNGGFVAPTTDVSCIDEVVTVSDEDALETARELARTMGLFVGISSGAVAYACRCLARKPEYEGKTIVTIFPDTGERYLSVWHDEPAPAAR